MSELMSARIAEATNGHAIYHARYNQYETDDPVPFRTSPEPFNLSEQEAIELYEAGGAITDFFQATARLYQSDGEARDLLDRGNPEIFVGSTESPNHLLIRPDLILTEGGFTVCEIETSPFGMALADILNRSYRQAGFETMVGSEQLTEHMRAGLPSQGTIVYSEKTKAYSGQLTYLADQILSSNGDQWSAQHVGDHTPSEKTDEDKYYRAFYPSEYDKDTQVQAFVDSIDGTEQLTPPD